MLSWVTLTGEEHMTVSCSGLTIDVVVTHPKKDQMTAIML